MHSQVLMNHLHGAPKLLTTYIHHLHGDTCMDMFVYFYIHDISSKNEICCTYVAGEGNKFSTLYAVQPNERKAVCA